MENPLRFFFDYLNDNGFNSLREDFFSYYLELYKYAGYCSVNRVKESVSFADADENGDKDTTVYFIDALKKRLKQELEESKEIIDKEILESSRKSENIDDYLKRLLQELAEIKDKSSELSALYPSIEETITLLNSHIQRKFDVRKYNLAEISVKENIVEDIFGFFKGKNDNGQKIMADDEYYRLIKLINELINNEKEPQSAKKFSKLNIPNNLLTFCFYVLHKKHYGIKPQKPYFIDFLKNNFSQLDNTSHNTIKTKFSVSPQILDKCIPVIVRDEAINHK